MVMTFIRNEEPDKFPQNISAKGILFVLLCCCFIFWFGLVWFVFPTELVCGFSASIETIKPKSNNTKVGEKATETNYPLHNSKGVYLLLVLPLSQAFNHSCDLS